MTTPNSGEATFRADMRRVKDMAEVWWNHFLQLPYMTSLMLAGTVTCAILAVMVGGTFNPSRYAIDSSSQHVRLISIIPTVFFATNTWHAIVNMVLLLLVMGRLEIKIGTILTAITLFLTQMMWWISFVLVGWLAWHMFGIQSMIVGSSPMIFAAMVMNGFLLERRDFTGDFALPVLGGAALYGIVFTDTLLGNVMGAVVGFVLCRGLGARIIPKQSRIVEMESSQWCVIAKRIWPGSFKGATTDWLDGQPSPFNRTNTSPLFHTWMEVPSLALDSHTVTHTTTPVSSKEATPLLPR